MNRSLRLRLQSRNLGDPHNLGAPAANRAEDPPISEVVQRTATRPAQP